MKRVFKYLFVILVSFLFFKGNVFAAFTSELISSSGKTAKYKITSTVKYTDVTIKQPACEGVASAKITWDKTNGFTGVLEVTFSSADCRGKVVLQYNAAEGCDENIAADCQVILDDARSMIGRIPYEMGGKCISTDFDTCKFDREWTKATGYPAIKGVTAASPGSEKHIDDNLARYGGTGHTGLDCSGFVWWIYYRNGINLITPSKRNYYHSSLDPAYSSALLSGVNNLVEDPNITQRIDKSQAQPCDLAVSTKPGSSSMPHIGIVSQTSGGYLYIHENNTNKNVTENSYFDDAETKEGKLVKYYRVLALTKKSDDEPGVCTGEETLNLDNSELCTCEVCDNVIVKEDHLSPESVINNCCLDGNSHIKEYKISELFCSVEDTDTKVNYYKDQCNNDLYSDDSFDGLLSDVKYCKVYCTEEMDLKVPGQIDSATGKFFKLANLDYTDLNGQTQTTQAPVITGNKTCTVKINYDKWRADYETSIKNEIRTYNELQSNLAYYELYKDANSSDKNITQTISLYCKAKNGTIKTKTKKVALNEEYLTGTGKSKCSLADGCTVDAYVGLGESYMDENGNTTGCSKTSCLDHTLEYETKNESVTCTNTYTEYSINANGKKGVSCSNGKCYASLINAQANSDFYDKVSYKGLKVTAKNADSIVVDAVTAAAKSDGCTDAIKGKENELSGFNCSATSTPKSIPDNMKEYDMKKAADDYKAAANGSSGQFKSFAESAATLENAIIKCEEMFYDNSFAAEFPENGGTNSSSDYFQLKPSVTFKYLQVYLNNNKTEKDWNSIEYGEATCQYKFKNTDVNDLDNTDEYYSSKFKTGSEVMTDLKYSSERITNTSSLPLDESKDIKKRFRQDAQYDAQCVWDTTDIPEYITLYPGPKIDAQASVQTSGEILITKHKYQYALYLTTYVTNYETYWELKDIGGSQRTKDKFIKAFNAAGNTCAQTDDAYSDGGEDSPEKPDGTSADVTCVIKVKNGGMRIGSCQYGVDYDNELCNQNNVPEVFEFRIADPKDLFPGNWSGKAANWKKTNSDEYGTTYNTIKKDADADKTYAPENLTYSFKLNSSSIKAIKKYNDERISSGGYDDFDLTCSCPGDIDTSACGTIHPDESCLINDGTKIRWKYTCRNCESSFLRAFAVDNTVNTTNKIKLDYNVWNNSNASFDSIRKDKSNWA